MIELRILNVLLRGTEGVLAEEKKMSSLGFGCNPENSWRGLRLGNEQPSGRNV